MGEENEKLFGLIGTPLGHSLSSFLHQQIFVDLKISGCYHAFEISEERVEAALEGMRALGFTGFNVTVPHKQRVIPYLDEKSPEVQATCAVNTVRIQAGRLLGFNTDVSGFSRALRSGNMFVNGSSAIILGAGGAARAVTFALIQDGVKEIYLCNRSQDRADQLVSEYSQSTGFNNFKVRDLRQDSILALLERSEFIINATSVGMWPNSETTPFEFSIKVKHMTAIDLVYNPLQTKFLLSANKAGARVMDGLNMFLFQGIESMQIWTARKIALDVKKLRTKMIERLGIYEQN
ncbi:MAG: shikimate dehydrogenase [bacterium]